MITNHLGKSPLLTQCAFKSECSVFISPTLAGSEVTIRLKDGAGKDLGVVFKGIGTNVSGIFLKENQALETSIDGVGDVFVSILEENTTLQAGVHFSAVHYVGDGVERTFALPHAQEVLDKSLVQVFIEGQEVREFALNGVNVEFAEAPFEECAIDIFVSLPQS